MPWFYQKKKTSQKVLNDCLLLNFSCPVNDIVELKYLMWLFLQWFSEKWCTRITLRVCVCLIRIKQVCKILNRCLHRLCILQCKKICLPVLRRCSSPDTLAQVTRSCTHILDHSFEHFWIKRTSRMFGELAFFLHCLLLYIIIFPMFEISAKKLVPTLGHIEF